MIIRLVVAIIIVVILFKVYKRVFKQKACSHCRAAIAKEAEVCHHCNTIQDKIE